MGSSVRLVRMCESYVRCVALAWGVHVAYRGATQTKVGLGVGTNTIMDLGGGRGRSDLCFAQKMLEFSTVSRK